MSLLLAHQGGWDEALYVVIPIAVFVGLQVWARRAKQRGRRRR